MSNISIAYELLWADSKGSITLAEDKDFPVVEITEVFALLTPLG